MPQIDMLGLHPKLYRPSAQAPAIVEVPMIDFLMIDGNGDPNTAPIYQESVSALYAVAYALKFALKKRSPMDDYKVMPMEGLWWVDDMRTFKLSSKDNWQWTLMIVQPVDVPQELLAAAIDDVMRKKQMPAAQRIRLERYDEGLAAQIMHIGPYADEEPTIDRLHAFIEEHGYDLRGKHHEIYLNDPRRTAAAKLRTIVRQPVAKGA